MDYVLFYLDLLRNHLEELERKKKIYQDDEQLLLNNRKTRKDNV